MFSEDFWDPPGPAALVLRSYLWKYMYDRRSERVTTQRPFAESEDAGSLTLFKLNARDCQLYCAGCLRIHIVQNILSFFDFSLLKSVVNSFSFENMSQASRSGRTSPSPPRSAGGTALAALRGRVTSLSRGASAVAGESPLSASSIHRWFV